MRCCGGSGFERPAFETIVASGPNSALPHARPGRGSSGRGMGWCWTLAGSTTDTAWISPGRFSLATRVQIFAVCSQPSPRPSRQAIAAVRPGVKASTVDDAARAALGRYGLEEAFGHGTGHGLGLEVHEEPRIGRPLAGQPDLVLQPGMVFTVEPGVYVDGVGGVRIEDDVLVTDDGCVVLTANGG